MKIGIVCYPTFGGSGVVATELGMALANKGHEVHFITSKHPVRLDLLSKNIHFHEVFVEEYPVFHYQPYELALSTKLVEVVSAYDLEILHVHYAIPHAYAAYMAKQMLLRRGIDVKVVTTLHGTDITLVGSHPTYKAAVEFSINNSDIVTSVSHDLKKDTLRLFNIDVPIHVIYNFIDFEQYPRIKDGDCSRSALASENEKIITHVSNMRSVKRPLDVVEVFYQIQKEVPSKLLLVGEGPEIEKVEYRVKELGIYEKVIFLGNSNDVYKVLCYSDLFILPSINESFGLAALEAMAAKTPVISTNTGGIPEVNIHGKTGFLSDLGNVNEMAANAIHLLKNEKLLNQFKQNAQIQAREFSMDRILPLYEEAYRSIAVGCC